MKTIVALMLLTFTSVAGARHMDAKYPPTLVSGSPITVSTGAGTFYTFGACTITTGNHAALAECSQDNDFQFSIEAGQAFPDIDLQYLVVDFAAGPIWAFTGCTTISVGVYSCNAVQ